MGEHKLPLQQLKTKVRKVYQLDESEKEFAKKIADNFKCDMIEAEQRVLMVKRFVLEHRTLQKEVMQAGVDLISAGIVVPTSSNHTDYPLSAFALLFESESRNRGDSPNLRLSMRLNAGGEDVRLIVMKEKAAVKLFGPFEVGGSKFEGDANADATGDAVAEDMEGETHEQGVEQGTSV